MVSDMESLNIEQDFTRVLILVLMEYGLWHNKLKDTGFTLQMS